MTSTRAVRHGAVRWSRAGVLRRCGAGIALLLMIAGLAPGDDSPRPPAPASDASTRPAAPVVSTAEIDRLVRQLGHPAWRMRERAQDRLAELGVGAEPYLRRLLALPIDSQTRLGIQAALAQIEGIRRLGPTVVTLHVKDAEPKAVFAEIGRQGHVPITALRESLWQRDWPHVTLDLVDRPFWEAVRSAGQQAGLRVVFRGGDDEPGQIVLTADLNGEMKCPAAFSGSFMAVATTVARRINFGETAPLRASDLTLQLTFFADPKWRIIDYPDDAAIEQVTDTTGRPLERPEPMHMQAFKSESPIWVMATTIPKVPAACEKLGRVRGSFRIVLLEQSEPLVIDDVMKVHNITRKIGRQSVALQDVVRSGDSYRVKLSLGRNGLSDQDWRQARESEGVQLQDNKGRPLPRGNYEAQESGDTINYEINFLQGSATGEGPDAPAAPARLVIQIPLEPREVTIPFELKDLPVEK